MLLNFSFWIKVQRINLPKVLLKAKNYFCWIFYAINTKIKKTFEPYLCHIFENFPKIVSSKYFVPRTFFRQNLVGGARTTIGAQFLSTPERCSLAKGNALVSDQKTYDMWQEGSFRCMKVSIFVDVIFRQSSLYDIIELLLWYVLTWNCVSLIYCKSWFFIYPVRGM